MEQVSGRSDTEENGILRGRFAIVFVGWVESWEVTKNGAQGVVYQCSLHCYFGVLQQPGVVWVTMAQWLKCWKMCVFGLDSYTEWHCSLS